MTRQAIKNRRLARRSSAATPDVAGGRLRARTTNQLLLQLPPGTRGALLHEADYMELPAGRPLARVGDAIASVYFPENGLFSLISQMTTGHQVAVAAVGAEGVLGIGAVLGMRQHPYSLVTLVPSHGHVVHAERFVRVFSDSEDLRRIALAYVGGRMGELTIAAACNRVHSHGQRLARWLLIATDKAHQRTLPVTHEALAQMVGGPRHAVSVALNHLRMKGAIAYRRGRVDLRKRSVLVQEACECYSLPGRAGREARSRAALCTRMDRR
jgi:CRP-like cAMP-binding protein